MLRGLYTSASGMISQQRKAEMLSNNIANVNTPGYKANQSSMRAFPELLLQRQETSGIPNTGKNKPTSAIIGGLNTGVYMQETIPNFVQGNLQATGRPTDLAIIDGNLDGGALFFAVEHPNGEQRYTRNGNFTVDEQGHLTTNNGMYVLGENGNRIQVPSGQFSVLDDGTVMEGNRAAGKLQISYSQNPQSLMKDEQGLFRLEDNQPLPTAPGGVTYNVRQGVIEGSNVNASQTQTDLMMAYRSFEANQKILQAYDRSLEKSVNEIGRLR